MAQCEILVEMTTYEEVTERADRTHLAWERNSLSDSCPSNSHRVSTGMENLAWTTHLGSHHVSRGESEKIGVVLRGIMAWTT